MKYIVPFKNRHGKRAKLKRLGPFSNDQVEKELVKLLLSFAKRDGMCPVYGAYAVNARHKQHMP